MLSGSMPKKLPTPQEGSVAMSKMIQLHEPLKFAPKPALWCIFGANAAGSLFASFLNDVIRIGTFCTLIITMPYAPLRNIWFLG